MMTLLISLLMMLLAAEPRLVITAEAGIDRVAIDVVENTYPTAGEILCLGAAAKLDDIKKIDFNQWDVKMCESIGDFPDLAQSAVFGPATPGVYYTKGELFFPDGSVVESNIVRVEVK